MLRRAAYICILWIACLPVNVFSHTYQSPVDYDITLAGNFGEPRPNHFHGGIDIKTGGVEGKHVYSIGDGYVSRLTVGLYGFGNAVYVTHPTGQTSIYCHLRAFSPKLRRLLQKSMIPENQPDGIVDVRLSPVDCPVSQGQLIAISGNTGHSTAPHLHLEIHDTRTWNMLDPLDYLGDYVSDGLPPTAHAFMAYPVAGEGVFNGSPSKQNFGFTSHQLERDFTAWGKVGFGLWANDYAEEVYNHYGIRETILTVDGQEVFRANVTNIPTGSNRQVNAWGDYDHWRHQNVWYMRSFIPPGCTLPMLHADANRGIVCFDQERDYHLIYILRDFRGNEAQYEWTVRGVRSPLHPRTSRRHAADFHVRHNRTCTYSRPGVMLTVPVGRTGDDVTVCPVVRSGDLSPVCTFSGASCPLFYPAELSLAVRQPVSDPSCLYITDQAGHDLGGVYHDGWVTTDIRELGASYRVAVRSDSDKRNKSNKNRI